MEKLPQIINYQGKQAVSAKDLYEQLGFDKSNWTKWYRKNISNNTFAIQNEDWQEVVPSTRTKDFAISIEFAKRLSMMARTEKGERIRQYFIQCEQKAQEVITHTPEELLLQNVQILLTHGQKIRTIETKLNEIEARAITSPQDYFAIAGYAALNKRWIDVSTAAKIGIKARAMCKNLGYVMGTIPDPRFGAVNTYPKEILQQVFKDFYK
ncbi:MAG TPA: antA/AntB antirepressor family protein [Ohtaekwangia sp.]|nr:antA/AntB antirepressor family protein [Ohtaekwangia sp.]